jgi:hypothetical protein
MANAFNAGIVPREGEGLALGIHWPDANTDDTVSNRPSNLIAGRSVRNARS